MMKYLLVAASVTFSPLMAAQVEASDYQVAVQRKRVAADRGKQVKSGKERTGTETIYYEVTVTNRAFNKPSNELEVKYVIFVERQELGEKQGSEKIERVRGDAKLEPLKAQGKGTFGTSEVTLREQSLSGGWVYTNGGRIRTRDSLSGIWIKIYDNGTEVGEYINPTTLRNKMNWE